MKYLNKIINLHFIAERTFYNKIKSHDDSLYIINFYYYPLQMYEFRWITIWTFYTFTIKINYFFPISVWIKIVFKTAPLRCLLIIRNIVTIYAKCSNRKIRSFDMKTVYEKMILIRWLRSWFLRVYRVLPLDSIELQFFINIPKLYGKTLSPSNYIIIYSMYIMRRGKISYINGNDVNV